ncbi:MAG: hypothetical protein ACRDPT_02415 [Streptomycetales bacterium]
MELIGDAYVTFTAPFYVQRDPLEPREACTLPAGDDLDGTGALLRSKVSLSPLLQGSLTYEQPTVDFLTLFIGGEAWRDDLRCCLNQLRANHVAKPYSTGLMWSACCPLTAMGQSR